MKVRYKKAKILLLSLCLMIATFVGITSNMATKTKAASITVKKTSLDNFKSTVHGHGLIGDGSDATFTYNETAFTLKPTTYAADADSPDNVDRDLLVFKNKYSGDVVTVDHPYKVVYNGAFTFGEDDNGNPKKYNLVVDCTELTMEMPAATEVTIGGKKHSNHGMWHDNQVVVASYNRKNKRVYAQGALWYGGRHDDWDAEGNPTHSNSIWGYGPSEFEAGLEEKISVYVTDDKGNQVDFSDIPRMYIVGEDLDIPGATGSAESFSDKYTESITPVSGLTRFYVDNGTFLDPSAYANGVFKPKDGTTNQGDDSVATNVNMVTDDSKNVNTAKFIWHGSGCGTTVTGAYIIRDVGNIKITKEINTRDADNTSLVNKDKLKEGITFTLTLKEGKADPLTGEQRHDNGWHTTATTDAKGVAVAKALPRGTYTISEDEISKPQLFTATSTQEVTLDYDSDDNVVASKDGDFTNPTTLVEVKKVDEKGQPLDGATFSVIEKSTGDKVVENFTTHNGSYTIAGLKKDTKYILREEKAPKGYKKDEDQEFTTGSDPKKHTTVTMKDVPAPVDITMSKTIKASEVYIDHGEPTFFETASGKDFENKDTYRTVSFTFTKSMIDDALAGKKYSTVIPNPGSHQYFSKIVGNGETKNERFLNSQVLTIDGDDITLSETVQMRYGTYTVNESGASRYELKQNGVSAVNGTVSGSTGKVKLDDKNEWGKVSFSNDYTRYDKWSHRDAARNHFGTSDDDPKYEGEEVPSGQ